eukprot:6465372-Pyramimonas_sp.AAC.1
MRAVLSPLLSPCRHLSNALAARFDLLGLEYVSHSADWGIQLRVDPQDDPRVLAAAAQLRNGSQVV